MQKLNERLMFLDNTLIMASTKKELIQVRDTLRFLLQTVGFLINKNKFELHSYQILQFLGVEINPNKNKCITSPIKEGQNYFKMSRHSRSIYVKAVNLYNSYKGVNTGVRLSLFHGQCSISGKQFKDNR